MNNKIELADGTALLVIAKDGQIVHHTFNISLSHAEFVTRTIGELPDGAWVGTLRKGDDELIAFNSRTFYGNQLPAPTWVQEASLAKFA